MKPGKLAIPWKKTLCFLFWLLLFLLAIDVLSLI